MWKTFDLRRELPILLVLETLVKDQDAKSLKFLSKDFSNFFISIFISDYQNK